MWSYWICDTRTGQKQLQVFPKGGGSWNRVLNDTGGGSHDFPLAATELTRAQVQALFQEWARTLVVCWDDRPVYAGLITGTTWVRSSKTLKVSHKDIRALLSKRYPFGVTSYWTDLSETTPGKLVCTNLQFSSIAARVVAAGLVGPTTIYSLPIQIPSGTITGPHSRTYENYNFRTVVDILEELQEEDGGPDIDFVPGWSYTGTLEWVMRTGSAAQPAIVGATYELFPDVPDAKAKVDSFARDGLKQATGFFSIGEGSEVDMLVAGRGLIEAQVGPVPALDTSQSLKSIDNLDVLASQSVSALALHRKLTQQFTVDVLAGGIEGLTVPDPGDRFRIWLEPDEWLPGGWVTARVIDVSGKGTGWLSVEVQPVEV